MGQLSPSDNYERNELELPLTVLLAVERELRGRSVAEEIEQVRLLLTHAANCVSEATLHVQQAVAELQHPR